MIIDNGPMAPQVISRPMLAKDRWKRLPRGCENVLVCRRIPQGKKRSDSKEKMTVIVVKCDSGNINCGSPWTLL
jgi:hypothetical protein